MTNCYLSLGPFNGQHNGTRIIITAHRRTPPHLCCAPVCASRSRCARKNAHIRLDASILLLVRPTNHSGSGWPPGQVWPPPLMVYSTTAASSAHLVYSRRVTSVETPASSGFVPHRFLRAQLAVKARTP